jgi:hypothetical protein
MSTPVFYFYGGEDIDFNQVGSGLSIDSAGGTFRSTYARCSLKCNNIPGAYWIASRPFTQTNVNTLWQGAQTIGNNPGGATNYIHWGLADASGIPRLEIRGSGGGSGGVFFFCKLDSVGTITQLGSTFFVPYSVTSLDKWDVFVNYSTTGSFSLYFNYNLIFTYSGDLTTNGVTSVQYIMLGCANAGNSGVNAWWSEVIVSDSDTRGMAGLVTLPPVANGNTHNFDVGTPAASNVNEILINDATFDGATTVGMIDQYTIGTLPAGSWQIVSVGIDARAERANFGGPLSLAGGVRSNGGDYWGNSLLLTNTFQNGYVTQFAVDPSTGVPWAALPTNIGIQATL